MRPPDTGIETSAQHLALIRGLTKPERLRRALGLTAFARMLVWEGAARGRPSGTPAHIDRFLLQLFGPDLTPELRRLLSQL